MARITILGGTGYAGGHIAKVAAERGHTVVSYSRNAPVAPVEGVEYRTGDLTASTVLEQAVTVTDVIVSAISPRGAMSEPGVVRDLEARVARLAAERNVRLGVIGGAGSLKVSEDGPLVLDTPGFPDEIKPEANELTAVLEDLRSGESGVSWFFVSPAGGFGSFAPGEATGTYRVGGDVLLTDEEGNSFISGEDLALAIVDEIETPKHENTRFTVAY